MPKSSVLVNLRELTLGPYMVQLLMSSLHKYLNEKPSMCDLKFYTDGAHTHRTFCSLTAYLGLSTITQEMSKM